MRISDVDFILIPSWLSGRGEPDRDDDHWIVRWEARLPTARWLDLPANARADLSLLAQIDRLKRPVMIVTHGAGVDILLSAGERLGARPVVGALIVAPHPCSPANPMKLGFPVVVIAPANHPEVSPIEALELTEALGGHFVDAGETERLDSSSGHGPWPEGLMRLGWFLKRLG